MWSSAYRHGLSAKKNIRGRNPDLIFADTECCPMYDSVK